MEDETDKSARTRNASEINSPANSSLKRDCDVAHEFCVTGILLRKCNVIAGMKIAFDILDNQGNLQQMFDNVAKECWETRSSARVKGGGSMLLSCQIKGNITEGNKCQKQFLTQIGKNLFVCTSALVLDWTIYFVLASGAQAISVRICLRTSHTAFTLSLRLLSPVFKSQVGLMNQTQSCKRWVANNF